MIIRNIFFGALISILLFLTSVGVATVSAVAYLDEQKYLEDKYENAQYAYVEPTEKKKSINSYSPPADIKNGSNQFAMNCAACHQKDGKGLTGLAPSIGNRDFLAIASDKFITETIVKGRPGTSMMGRPDLKGKNVTDIIAYLRSLPVSIPLNVNVDPDKHFTGDSKKGADKFKLYCASCHGDKGQGYSEGVPGPAIGKKGFLDMASDDYIYKTLKHGRIGTAMRAFIGPTGVANLSDQDAYDIISHLRVINNKGQKKAPVVTTQIVTKGNAKEGHEAFKLNCSACHKADGTGTIGLAPSIRNRDFLALASDDFIRQTIKKGRMGTSMIARPDLSEKVVGDMIAYLRSLEVKNPVKIHVDHNKKHKGDAQKGKNTFAIHCASCHGDKGVGYSAGGSGPAIGTKGFLDVASDDYIYKTLKLGRIGTAMRSFIGAKGLSNLTDEDAGDIIQYLRSL